MMINIPIQRRDPTIDNYRQIKLIYKQWNENLDFSSFQAMIKIGEVLKDDNKS